MRESFDENECAGILLEEDDQSPVKKTASSGNELATNKYEEEEKLLRKYENECKYGYAFDHKRDLEIGIRSENAQNLIKNLHKKHQNASPSTSTLTSVASATTSLSPQSNQQSDSSRFLLDQLLGQLANKNIKESTTATVKLNQGAKSSSSSFPLQFNNYATPVDELSKFGLKSEWNLNREQDDAQTSTSSSSASSTSSSSGMFFVYDKYFSNI